VKTFGLVNKKNAGFLVTFQAAFDQKSMEETFEAKKLRA
jgi:hypothetical protein